MTALVILVLIGVGGGIFYVERGANRLDRRIEHLEQTVKDSHARTRQP